MATDKFRKYLRLVEGGEWAWDRVKKKKVSTIDPKTGNWLPYQDSQGYWTIGVGHLITKKNIKRKDLPKKWKKGLSPSEVDELLDEDVVDHSRRARSSYEDVYGKGTWDELDLRRKEMATEIEFNGTLKKFPSFMEALFFNDEQAMALDHHRNQTKDRGTKTERKVPMPTRNRHFSNNFGLKYIPHADAKAYQAKNRRPIGPELPPEPERGGQIDRTLVGAGNTTLR